LATTDAAFIDTPQTGRLSHMHELQVTERILNIVLQHAAGQEVSRIVRIHLRVGALSDLEDEWIQHYFDYLSRGTLAEKAELAITRAPIVARCDACACSFEVKREALGSATCPACGELRLALVSGREYLIENMEVL
jgi:hydrogenase nickel incorporation protein HypA/HybF